MAAAGARPWNIRLGLEGGVTNAPVVVGYAACLASRLSAP
jgi:hypothetical protein